VEVCHRSTASFVIDAVRFDRWVHLPADIAARIREGLHTCSFPDVIAGEKPPQRVLVQEAGMEYKPSLLASLSAEKILSIGRCSRRNRNGHS
jgi:hypothetical protein